MGLFRRSENKTRANQDRTIQEFWTWWRDGGRTQAQSLLDDEERTPEQLEAFAGEVSRHADKLGLAFEIGPGRKARQVLVLTAAGDPQLRDVAQRWLAAAPVADDNFEFSAYRLPAPAPEGASLTYEGSQFGLSDMTFVPRVAGRAIDITVHHPSFGGFPDEVCGQVTFLLLDTLIGEQAVEENIGAVAWTGEPLPGAVPLLDLPAFVSAARQLD